MRADDAVAAAARVAPRALSRPLAWLTGVNSSVGTWSTLVLNVADLSRFAPSQRDQALGQAPPPRPPRQLPASRHAAVSRRRRA